VAAAVDATAAGERALAVAVSLAQGSARQLCVLVPETAGGDLGELRRRVSESLGVAPEVPRIVQLPAPVAASLAREAARLRPQALVLPAGFADVDLQVRLLLEGSGCPLVLVP
jgi:hypothetical protein